MLKGWFIFENLYQDPRDYFDSQQANAIKTLGESQSGSKHKKSILNAHEAYGSLRKSISEIKDLGLTDPIIKSEVAMKVIFLPLTHLCCLFWKNIITQFMV